MAFATTSPVRNIEISLAPDIPHPNFIGWEWWNGTSWVEAYVADDGGAGGFLISAGDYTDDLKVLQQKYAAGTLTDDMGNTVVPSIDSNTFGITTITHLEERGIINPLDPDGLDKWLTSQKFGGRFYQKGTVTATALKLATDIESEDDTEPGGNFDLTRFHVSANGAMTFQITIHDLNIETAQFHNAVPIMALVAFLNARKTAGSNIVNPTTANGDWINRTFDFTNFTIVFTGTSSVTTGSRIRRFDLFGTATDTAGSYSREALETAIHVGQPLPDSVDVPQSRSIKAQRILVGGREFKEENFQLLIDDTPLGQVKIGHISTAGTPFTSANGEWHYDGEVPATVNLPRPRLVTTSGHALPITYENQGTGLLTIRFGNPLANVVTLRKGQRADLKIVFDNQGGERLLGRVPPRRMVITQGAGGMLSVSGYYNYDATRFARPAAMPAAQHVDADAFTIPAAGTITENLQWNVTNAVDNLDTFEVLKDGYLIFYQNMVWQGVSGNIPAGTQTRIEVVRNGVLLPSTVLNTYGALYSSAPNEFTWLWLGEVKKGDKIYPLITYPKGSTMNLGTATVSQSYRIVRLDQTIDIDWE